MVEQKPQPLPFDKLLPPLTAEEMETLVDLSKKPLAGFKESDVREAFLAPLIDMLGYRRGEDYDVHTEHSIGLSPPFIMFGHHSYNLDYLCAVWKQGFWLLEAKAALCADPANPPGISDEDFGQAFAYAIHPQIDAPLFVVSNGWWTNLYDRDSGSTAPLISISQNELPARFDELRTIIDASQVTFHLKRQLLARIEKVLAADVTFRRSEDFVAAVERVVAAVRPQVLENFRTAGRREREKHKRQWAVEAEAAPLWRTIDTQLMAAWSVDDVVKLGDTIAERVLSGSPRSGHVHLLFSRLLLEELRPVTTQYYVNAFYVLCAIARRRGEAQIFMPSSLRTGGAESITAMELFSRWASMLLHHLRPRPELRMLWAVEAITGRIAKRILVYARDARDHIVKGIESERYALPEEALAWLHPSPARSLLVCVAGAKLVMLAEFLRQVPTRSNREWKAALARQEWLRLLAIEQALEKATPDYSSLIKELGQDWTELQLLDHVNKDYDPLGVGVCSVLGMFPDLLRQLHAECYQQIALLAGLRQPFSADCCKLLEICPVPISER